MGPPRCQCPGPAVSPSPSPLLRNSHILKLQGLLNVAGTPCVAYEPTGLVFAVLLNLRSTLLLYDLKNFDKQPFLSVTLDDPILFARSYPSRVPIYTSLSFSNDGKWLLVGTSGDVHYIVDAFEGTLVARLESEYSSVPY